MRRPLLLVSAFALCECALTAQQEETPVFRAGVAYVRVDVQVLDGSRAVAGFSQADFQVFDEEEPRKIQYFARESEPLALMLLLDVSGSMRRMIEQMTTVAHQALGQLAPGDRVGVMLFARNTRVFEELTDDLVLVSRRLRQALFDASLGSGTAINSAIIDAAAYLEERAGTQGRRAILIATDNFGLNYRVPDEDAVRALYRADAVLNAMLHGKAERPEPPEPGHYRNPDFTPPDVYKIAELTGGEAIRANKAGEAFRGLIERIRTRYSMHYAAPEAAPGTFRRIRVELAAQARSRYPKAIVRARCGYYVK